MREIEKILEEIDGMIERYKENPRLEVVDICYGLNQAKRIIRKHMNDGWIPVEDRLPEKNEYFVDTSNDNDFPNGYYRRFEIVYMTDTIEYIHGYYDGYKWINKWHETINNVLAWKIHEPYRLERSVEE